MTLLLFVPAQFTSPNDPVERFLRFSDLHHHAASIGEPSAWSAESAATCKCSCAVVGLNPKLIIGVCVDDTTALPPVGARRQLTLSLAHRESKREVVARPHLGINHIRCIKGLRWVIHDDHGKIRLKNIGTINSLKPQNHVCSTAEQTLGFQCIAKLVTSSQTLTWCAVTRCRDALNRQRVVPPPEPQGCFD